MTILKALIGGILGGGLGAFAAGYLQPMLHTSLPWTVLLAGLLAGLGVRIVCGTGRNFMTGVIAAVTAILGIVGISYMDSMVMFRSAADDLSKPFVVVKVDEEEDTEKGVEEETEEKSAEEKIADGNSADGNSADGNSADEEVDIVVAAKNPADDVLTDGNLRRELSEPGGSAGGEDGYLQKWMSKEVIFDGLAALLAFLLGSGSAAATAAVGKPASNEETPDQGGGNA